MKYKFCSIRKNVTKYDVTLVTKGGILISLPRGYVIGAALFGKTRLQEL